MSKSVLFVCRSCHITHPKPPDGAILFDHLLTLHQTWSRRLELDIRPVDCLWVCAHPCAIALSCPNKSIYVLAEVPVAEDSIDETVEAVLCLSERYLDSKDGKIPWKNFPAVLQTDIVAQIPPLPPSFDTR
ncbi:DUF1636 domain-containing protein [Synechococcales cyanobacterium C]|uniref:DUF1636 domain-containing protein n=1 Tax=Petrachloros mirabilis ULC683 TaxID=2781853 RepID=A0A8K2A2J1_9CYAN|nr:DUF1636 domain-containing protein [Petrachloros mirabilis]NCJ08621.1 DUF1636 domain-containing protein [Petrachloros mirabilis ULC683]